MKCLLKPTSPFMLMLDSGEVVEAHRPSVVTVTAMVNSRLASGQLKLIAPDLPMTTTDDDFRKFWRDSSRDEALAVESFLSQFKAPEPIAATGTIEGAVETIAVPVKRRK